MKQMNIVLTGNIKRTLKKMNKKTENALLKSIEHWHQNLNMLLVNHLSGEENLTKDIEIYSDHCALCKMFGRDWLTCNDDCPIVIKTGQDNCLDSPHENVEDWFIDGLNNFEKGYDAISKELEFLYSLLEEEQ
jgi:hypothetical protein